MIGMMNKKAAKIVEPDTERWENIALYTIKSYPERTKLLLKWMDIIRVGKEDLLTKTFGKQTFQIDYSVRNKVWALVYEDYIVMIFRSKEGTSMQVSPTMPKKLIVSFIDLLHKEWKSEIKKSKSKWKTYKKRIIN